MSQEFDTKFLCYGGIGVILENNQNSKEIIKVSFVPISYTNNIKYHQTISKLFDTSKLTDYFILSFENNASLKKKLDKINKDSIYKFFLQEKNKLEKFGLVEDNISLYILKYEKFDGNVYSLLINSINHPGFINLFIFVIYWTMLAILTLNKNGVYHNDIKLDNLLFKRRPDYKYKLYTKFKDKVGYRGIYNSTKYCVYLHDFDLTSNKLVNNDITSFKKSISSFINQHDIKNKQFQINLENKLSKTYSLSDVEDFWLSTKTSTFRSLLISDLLDRYLETVANK